MDQSAYSIAFFTITMGLLSTALALPPGVAAAYLLARRSFFGKPVVETLLVLPLVVPPVATGFILLKLLGRNSLLGQTLDTLGLEVHTESPEYFTDVLRRDTEKWGKVARDIGFKPR